VTVPRSAVPTRRLRRVFHVGTLKPEDQGQIGAKDSVNLEGHHFSVSSCPDDWRRIARLGSLPEWVCTHPQGRFVEAHKLSQKQWDRVLKWAHGEGLLRWEERWHAWTQDEDGGWRYSLHATPVQAAYESGAGDEDDGPEEGQEEEWARTLRGGPRGFAAECLPVAVPTPELRDRTGMTSPEADSGALIAWAQAQGCYQGVWWNDLQDQYSAPRGLIFREGLHTWAVARSGPPR
jgi:hypothetical protein